MRIRTLFIFSSFILLLAIGLISLYTPNILWSLLIVFPIVLIGCIDLLQKKHSIRRNFPVIGNFRYLLEMIRPEIMQYFVETDTDGKPLNRIFRSLIYQRAKNVNDTTPFGTKMDVYRNGYECMAHSIYPKNIDDIEKDPRIKIGGPHCKFPYSASLLNISAMSFGALSKNAILALNKGASLGKFAHNTGEGSISPYHLKYGGDLIWQIGTAYFGCRDAQGNFSSSIFKKQASIKNVKMIEIKLSQGAKPGHGGILPGIKNTKEIAKVRGVKPHQTVSSPPYHSEFSSPKELLNFIKNLRDLTLGKPIGFKLCVGDKSEFIDICKAMKETGITPDFITVDGGEGGTGAAPVEFSNSLGFPLREGLSFVNESLKNYDLRKDIKIIASAKIVSAFHMVRCFALGADICYSARAMMMALGCIQALECNSNTCPTGIATQDTSLIKGLDVNDKFIRVANYHKNTIHSFNELLAAAGLSSSSDIEKKHVFHRLGPNQLVTYEKLYHNETDF